MPRSYLSRPVGDGERRRRRRDERERLPRARAGGTRPRAVLVRFWKRQNLLRVHFPLTGAAALRADAPWEADAWIPVFLDAIAGEAEDGLQLGMTLERAWFAAGRRSTSRAAIAIDVLARASFFESAQSPDLVRQSAGGAWPYWLHPTPRRMSAFCWIWVGLVITVSG